MHLIIYIAQLCKAKKAEMHRAQPRSSFEHGVPVSLHNSSFGKL